ncbi:MAG: hypothetical protein V3T27_00325 [Alphaproteobacteria bacterium]
MRWVKVAGVIILIVIAGGAAWWLQDALWSAAGFGVPWWGYVAFWGAVGLLILVLKRTGPKDEDEDDGLPRPPGIG